MPLGTKELYLVLRARDEASRVLRNVAGNIRGLDRDVAAAAQRNIAHGQALTTIGVAVAASAVLGLHALNDMTNAAIDYNNAAARTLTQTDGLKTSVKQLADLGRQVAREIPAPFEQMQSTLYDIFSSMDVNIPQARKLLKQFAKDSVGGATDIETAGRSVIQILNAFKVPIKNVSTISDVMFQLVRKGVGTYQQFAASIGRAVPSAVRAGQSIQTLAGMLAFLTRNGLSTAMSATSAARALDALSNPRAIRNLKKLGVQVVDNKGKFRPLVDIIKDMNKHTKDMSKPERSAWLTDAFKGAGGTIQAMRFFNLAISDTHKLLPKMTDDMKHAKGAAAGAYKIMSQTPAAQIQLLKNRFEALKTEVGDRLIPVKMLLVKWLNKVLDLWDKLSPKTKDLIVKIAVFASAFALIVGAVTAVAGVMLMLMGALALTGGTLVGFLLPIGLVVAAIVAIGVGIYELYKHWGKVWPAIKKVIDDVWPKIVDAGKKIWENLKNFGLWFWGTFGPGIKQAWQDVKDAFDKAKEVINTAIDAIWGKLKDFGTWFWSKWGPGIQAACDKVTALFSHGTLLETAADHMYHALEKFGTWFWKLFGPAITKTWDTIKKSTLEAWGPIRDAILGAWDSIKKAFDGSGLTFKQFIDIVVSVVKVLWDTFKPVLAFLAVAFVQSIVNGIKLVGAVFQFLATLVKNVLPPVIDFVATVLGDAWKIIKDFVGLVDSLMKGDWKGAWEYVKKILHDNLQAAADFLRTLGGVVVGIVKGMVLAIIGWLKWLYDEVVGHSIIPDLVRDVISWFAKLPSAMANIAKDIWKQVVQKFNEGWAAVRTVVSNGVTWVRDKFTTARQWLVNGGANIIRGLWDGISSYWKTFATNLGNMISNIRARFDSAKTWLVGRGSDMITGLKDGINNAMSNIGNWIKGSVVDPIVNSVKKFFGIHSPSKVMAGLGGHLISGLLNGMMNSGAGSIAKTIFGGFPGALSALLQKGMIGIGGLPTKALDALLGAGGFIASGISKALASIVVPYDGQKLDLYTLKMLQRAEKYLGHRIDISQGSFSTSVGASAGTHAGGGAFDVSSPLSLAVVGALRKAGFAAWLRLPSQGPWAEHIHALAMGDPRLSAPAMAQVASFLRGGSGLASGYANGGWINEPIWGVGKSGRRYTFGEKESELVVPGHKVGAGGNTQYITINTQEIDPTRHAAQLGWLLANRVT